MTMFNDLNLNTKILKAIAACGYTEPTEIQDRAIPVVLTGKDLIASAQTGTGKTAAFVLPTLERLTEPSTRKGKGPRVLILTPTRELSLQVNKYIEQFGRFTNTYVGNVVGGMAYGPQIRLLSRPFDLLVATPGRLLDHMNQGRLDFSRLEMLILDEADRMLDMGFIDDVRKIGKAIPEPHQTLLFSATLEGKIMTIARELMNDPEIVQLTSNHKRHESIQQQIHFADNMKHKHRLLNHHVEAEDLTKALIFTATKRMADELSKILSDLGHSTAALHGDMRQAARKRTVDQMRRGKYRLLVATDVASRGLDIKGISHVINFDLPMVAEDYIHRIGRTGRAGETGIAISLVGPNDFRLLRGIEKLTGVPIQREIIPGLEPRTPEPKLYLKGNSDKPNRSRQRFGGGRRPSGGNRYGGGNRSEGGSRYGGGNRSEGGSRYGGGNRSEGGNSYSGGSRSEGSTRYSGGSR
ncbi:MAG TPA: DEAD/DEAH box helicase, partial [Verrucomicrobiales bacterium]|nr:DEAD/DEAH box helicase [Verrucomicrobiales bacterium]